MSKTHNWEETDSLLEQLRAKIREDASDSDETPTAPPVADADKEEGAEEAPAAKKTVDRSSGKKKRRNRSRSLSPAQQAAERTENHREAVTGAENGAATAHPENGSANTSVENSAANTIAENAPAVAEPTPAGASPATEHTMSEADAIAGLTVESLVKDIFGAAKRIGNADTADAEPESHEPEKKDPELPEKALADEPVGDRTPATADAGEEKIPASTDGEGRASFEISDTDGAENAKGADTDPEAPGKADLLSAFSIEESSEGAAVPKSELSKEDIALRETVGSSEENLKLLLDLDYEEELGNVIGFDKIREYRELGVNGAPVSTRRGKRKANARREYEFAGQEKTIRKDYQRRKKGNIVRLVFSLLILLLIFFYEHPAWLPLLFRGPLDGAAYPRPYILFGLQLLLIDAALCYRHLKEGLISFFRFSPVDYSLCSVAVVVTALYHVVLLFLPADGVPTLYLSPAAAGLVLMSLADLFDWYREFSAFRVVSSKRQKYALISRVSVGGKQNSAREKLFESEQDETVLYARPVGFVRNYFANTERRVEYNKTLGTRLFPVLAVGLACGLYTAAASKGGSVFRVVLITFFLCLPCISLLMTSLPMFLASLMHLGKDGAIIGEEPVYRCGGKTALVMPANEMFEKMKHEQFELADNCDIQRTLVLARALLEKVQSPLVASVDVDEELRVSPDEVELTEVAETGVCATVGVAKTPLMLGSAAYLRAHGIGVQQRGEEQDSRRMLLFTVEGKVCAVFLARYRLDRNVNVFLSDLREEDVRMMVRTKDPGVYNEMFRSLTPDADNPVQVIKPTAKEMDIRTDRVDATIVALDSCMAVGETFLVCRKIRRAGLFGRWLQLISMGVGAVLAILLSFFGKLQVFTPTMLTLYIFFWSVLDAIASYLYLRDKENL